MLDQPARAIAPDGDGIRSPGLPAAQCRGDRFRRRNRLLPDLRGRARRSLTGERARTRTHKGLRISSESPQPSLAPRLILDPVVERLGGLVERVLEIIVLGVQERFQRDLLGLGGRGPSKKLRARTASSRTRGCSSLTCLRRSSSGVARRGRASSRARGWPRRGPGARGR